MQNSQQMTLLYLSKKGQSSLGLEILRRAQLDGGKTALYEPVPTNPSSESF